MDTPEFLAAGDFVDSKAPRVVAFAQAATADATGELDKVLRLYRAVRDGIVLRPRCRLRRRGKLSRQRRARGGAGVLHRQGGAAGATARAVGVPARVGYADVRNHLTSPRLYELMRTDVLHLALIRGSLCIGGAG